MPEEPKPPLKPRGALDAMRTVMSLPSLMHLSPTIPEFAPSVGNVSSLTIKKGNSYDVSFGIHRLKQHINEPSEPLFVVFTNQDEATSFGIDYRINAANLPNEVKGKLHLVVKHEPN